MQRRVVTLFELGMLASLVGWTLSLATSVIEARRFAQNEIRAASVLQAIRESEDAFRRSAHLDRDGDGSGEYGFLLDIRAADPKSPLVRGLRPIGRGAYETEDSTFDVTVFLPDDASHGVSELNADRASPKESEQCFVAYAWPATYARTGIRAFCLLADGRFLITENGVKQYSGLKRRPTANAALYVKEEHLCGPNAGLRPSNDRQAWSMTPK
ncbi:MAG: hypothetical protein HYR85_02680 [Planctomycetes bacterium]|nr:hypothetical protein [Planctomycetota bacterium]MBI3844660.1 hypothetical protein [Planctomycetota bacterium]